MTDRTSDHESNRKTGGVAVPGSAISVVPPPVEYWFEEGCFIVEWLNTTSEPDVSIARARVPVGTSTRWHRLTDVRERYVILSGEGIVELGSLPATRVTAGSVVGIAPGDAQRIRNTGSEDLVFLAICTPRFEPACYQALAEPDGQEAGALD